MNIVGGHKNSALDKRGSYKRACVDMAERLGWDAGTLHHWWEQFALIRISHQRWPRQVAEWMAMHDLSAFFDKAGKNTPD